MRIYYVILYVFLCKTLYSISYFFYIINFVYLVLFLFIFYGIFVKNFAWR